MATVKFKFHYGLKKRIDYVTKDRGDDDVISGLNCDPDTALDQMKSTRKFHGKTGDREVFELIQSFSPLESAMRSPMELHALAKTLTENLFPGYEAVIRTHTDKGHTHTHIRMNTVHPETGVRIRNKKQWGQFFGTPSGRGSLDAPEAQEFTKVYRSSKEPENFQQRMLHVIRRESDRIVQENGLSIIEGKPHARGVNRPDKLHQMDKFRKTSWVLDLMQKATFARALSTSYDEYVGYLREFQIDARVERKNISYTYPPGGADRVIRGKSLGKHYDKEGLEINFAHNDLMFSNRPYVRAELRKEWVTLKTHSGRILRDAEGVLQEPGGTRTIFTKDYGAFKKTSRRDHESRSTSELDLSHSILPIEEVKRAKGSLFDYCKKHDIPLMTDAKGRTVLKGREHIVLTDQTLVNTRSKVHGNLIDFVAIHQNLTYVQALAQINNNPRLLLLEQHFGSHQRTFNPFYVPKSERMERTASGQTMSRFLQSIGAGEGASRGLMERGQAHISKQGIIRIFGEKDTDGALEFTEGMDGKWTQRRLGRPRRPLYKGAPQGKSVHIFADAKDFLARHGEDVFGRAQAKRGVLALLTPEPEPIDTYLAEHRHVIQLKFVAPKQGLSRADLDFFGVLKARYQHLGIQLEHTSRVPEHSHRGPDLEL